MKKIYYKGGSSVKHYLTYGQPIGASCQYRAGIKIQYYRLSRGEGEIDARICKKVHLHCNMIVWNVWVMQRRNT